MIQYFLIFLAGLAGSAHCMAMCGGFACALGSDPRGNLATLRRHLIYNLGRLSTYCFLGAVVGYLGVLLVGHGGEATAASLAQRLLAAVSGLLMVFIGLRFFGFFQRINRSGVDSSDHFLVSELRTLLKAPGAAAPLAFGVLNGFLPCPLVYAFAAQAAGSGGALPGLVTMAAFGLGTFPALLVMGGVGGWLRHGVRQTSVHTVRVNFPQSRGTVIRFDWRQHSVRIAGGFIVMLGIITFARGLLPMTAHMHG
jgi:sulfite exporter TauE/SafE